MSYIFHKLHHTFLFLHLSASYQASFGFEITIGTLAFVTSFPLQGGFGAAPVRNVRRYAHPHKKRPESIRAFYLLFMPLYISACCRRSLWVYLCHQTNPLSLKRISTSVPFATLSAIFRAIFSLNDKGSSDSFFLSIA